MAKVICGLPNASELINGIKFVEHKLGMISEEIEDDVAEAFTRIKGYVLAGKNAAKELASQTSSATQGAQTQAPEPVDNGAQTETKPEGDGDPANPPANQ